MKKTGLFKIILFVLLGLVVATWIFSASYYSEGQLAELGMYNIGFFDYFSLIFGTFEFSYFIQILLLLVSIGALYGVLGKTGKYRAWIEKIAKNNKGKEFLFLVITSFVIAALTSVFDYGFTLLVFFPLLISIILAMGYDKVTAIVTTFGAMLVGTIGSILGYKTAHIAGDLLSLGAADGLFYKIALFLGSYILLMLYLSKAKKVKSTKETTEADLFMGEKISNKYSIVPIIVMFVILFVLLIVGCTNWETTFGVSFFTKMNESVMAWSPKLPYFHITTTGIDAGLQEVAIFSKIFGDATAFGEWYYSEMAVMCLVFALIIGRIYKVENRLEEMGNGMKKMLKPAFMVMMCYCVIYFAGNHMFFPTIASWILKITSKFSVAIGSIVMAIGSALHVDFLYAANYVIPQMAADNGNPTTVSLIAQSIYGVTMFAAPTSALLVFGLTYLGVPYTEWIKKTWKLILGLLAVVLVILLIANYL